MVKDNYAILKASLDNVHEIMLSPASAGRPIVVRHVSEVRIARQEISAG